MASERQFPDPSFQFPDRFQFLGPSLNSQGTWRADSGWELGAGNELGTGNWQPETNQYAAAVARL
jgi:hypothetical protein